MNLCIAPTDASFCKYQDHAKVPTVFKRWSNCLILCKIIFQLEIPRDVQKSACKRTNSTQSKIEIQSVCTVFSAGSMNILFKLIIHDKKKNIAVTKN